MDAANLAHEMLGIAILLLLLLLLLGTGCRCGACLGCRRTIHLDHVIAYAHWRRRAALGIRWRQLGGPGLDRAIALREARCGRRALNVVRQRRGRLDVVVVVVLEMEASVVVAAAAAVRHRGMLTAIVAAAGGALVLLPR